MLARRDLLGAGLLEQSFREHVTISFLVRRLVLENENGMRAGS